MRVCKEVEDKKEMRGTAFWKRLFASGDGSSGRGVVVDEDTDTSIWRTELDLGSLLQSGLGKGQGTVEARSLALHQAALGTLLLHLSLVDLAGLEILLGYTGNGKPGLLRPKTDSLVSLSSLSLSRIWVKVSLG